MHATGVKRGKKHASEARLVLVLLLIGLESGANFVNQSQSAVKQNQSKHEITFDTQLKTALYPIHKYTAVQNIPSTVQLCRLAHKQAL